MLRPAKFSLLIAVILAVAAFAVAGCGDDGDKDGSGSKSNGKTPAPLKAGGELLFCSDIPYPPAEYYDGSTPVGYEIDIAKEVAKRLDTTAKFQKTGFDGILAALLARKCDSIMSSMNSTAERKKQVDFVDYMQAGQSLLVAKGDEQDVTELSSLSGKVVAVQVGTTLRDAVEATNKDLEKDRKDPIDVKTFPGADQAADALRGGSVDAFFVDSPVAADYVNKSPDTFAMGGSPIDPLPLGMAFRKQDTKLSKAAQEAIDAMYADGAMSKILKKWKVEDFALPDKGGE